MSRFGPKRWVRWLAILGLAVLHPSLAAAQEDLSRSPVNPAFEQYQAARQQGMARTMTAGGHPLGYVPAPLNLKHTAGQGALIPRPLYGLPSSYDLRTQSKLTDVRDQGPCGDCWAFGTFASLESYLLTGETWDFSENNLKNTHGFDFGPCAGGNAYMSAAYLSQWSGPINEVDDPYNPFSGSSPPGLPVRKHIQEVLFLPLRANATDNDTIKQAVMAYGAVTTSFYYNGAYYNSGTYAYYYNGTNYANHEVAIVGWDDNFDKSKFNSTPPGNGAFIIKNSWGAGWGQAGYFYISYYDTQIGMNENAAFENAESTANYARVYQYDPLGWVASIGAGDTTAWFANVFTAIGAEQLRAVSFYTPSVNSSYEIYIFQNPSSPPVGGSPVSSMTGTITYPGYHTLALTTPVALTAGQKFSVVIKLTTPGYNWPIPIEFAWPGYSSGATAAAGQSYLSTDGASWDDATTAFDPTCNVCIKAFTVATPPGNIAVTPGTLDFGTVMTGMTAQASFTVTNSVSTTVSNGTVTVTGPPGGGFTIVSGATFSVPGFSSTNVVVQFVPPSVGGFTNIVVFATANGGISTNTVTGTGGIPIAPVASFTASPTFGVAPLAVTFMDSSTGTITNRVWDFGDGTTTNFAIATNPGHAYSAIGTYTVSLTVSGPLGTDTLTRTNYIVSMNALCQTLLPVREGLSFGSVVAGQTYCYQASGCIQLNMCGEDVDPDGNHYTNDCTMLTATPYVGGWFFPCTNCMAYSLVGEFSGGSWIQLGKAGTFVAPTSGTLTLHFNTDAGADCCSSRSWDVCIAQGQCPSVVADFTGSPTSGPVPLAVTFTDTSSGGTITNWFWDFGDGTTTNFADATNPVHTYNAVGTYTASLAIFGPSGSSARTRSNYIVALNPAHLVVNPASLNFGSVNIGRTNSLNFSVINTGDLSLTGTATGATAPFTVTSPPSGGFTVASGHTQTVTVAFTPVAAGTANGSVIFTSNGGDSTNAVTGLGVCTYALSPTNGVFGTPGGSGSFTVNTPDTCEWTPITTNGWIHPNGTGPGTGPVNYTVDGNTSTNARSGRIIVQDKTYTVTQSGCSYSLGTYTTSSPTWGATNTVNVITTSPCPWTATPNNAWLTIQSGDSGVSSGTVTYVVAPNASSNARTGTVNIAGRTFTVTQAGCSYALGTSGASFPTMGGTNTFNVNTTSPCPWTPTTTNGWLTILSGWSGVSSGTVTYVVAPNASSNARTGTVNIAGRTFTVTQAGCSYALGTSGASFPAKGGTNAVNVNTTSPCPWTATTNNVWLTILSGGSGVSSGTVTYVVAPNGSSNARTGTVSIAGRTFTVSQTGNTAPQVSITPVSPVTLPVVTVNLNATATDSDGAPSGTVSTAWSKVSGVGSVTFGSLTTLNTTATFSTNGTYVLRLTASDGALSTSSNVAVIVNGPPVITSPPAATNKLAQVDDLPVVAGYEPVCFSVGMFDPDFNALYCLWDFGDGVPITDCDPCYVFTNCGQYVVSVAVSDGLVSTNATGLVNVACQLTVTKLRAKLNFAKQNADSASLSAILDLDAGFSVTNKPVITLDIGGAQVPFTLDAKGKGRGVSPFGSCTCKLAYNKKTGLWTLTAKLAKGSWKTSWAAYGLVNATIPSKPATWVTMPVVVVIDADAYAAERPMRYTAKAGKSGSAK